MSFKEGRTYDVFLSLASADRVLVEQIDHRLRGSSLSTFLDRRELRKGVRWIEALEEAMARSRAAAIFIGPHGLGNVQQYERDLALMRQRREREFPVIPVLLPGCEPPTGFLELLTWVDFRNGLDGPPDSLSSLIAAVRREPAGAESVREHVCPYRGLDAFREEDSPFFCGRDASIKSLVASVESHRLVAVVGKSGSGKSSLVFAGLLPALRRERATVWDVLSVRPGMWPLHALVGALEGAPEEAFGKIEWAQRVDAATKNLDASTVARVISQRLDATPEKADRLLLYVDQWEELYSMAPAPEEVDAAKDHSADVERFVALIAGLAADGRARTKVVLTVRADFYGSLMGHLPLASMLPKQQVNIGPLTRDDVRAAIATPAKKAGLTFDPERLVDDIVEDAGTDEAVLPLLQYALKETWLQRSKATLTATGYMKTGGVRGALEAAATRTYAALGESEKAIARRLFLGLVTPGEGREDTRARTTMPTDPAVLAVVAKFAHPNARLLVTGVEPAPTPVDLVGDSAAGKPSATRPGGAMGTALREERVRATLEIAHEALIRAWSELREWLDANRETLRTRAAIAHQNKEWESNGRRDDLLLQRGFSLERAHLLLANHGDVPVNDLNEYINLSERAEQKLVEAEQASYRLEQARIRRQSRNRAILAITAGATAVVMAGVSAFAFMQRTQANAAADQARNFAVFSAGSQASDPTLRAVILREVHDPVPIGWEAAAMSATMQTLAQNIFEGHRDMIDSVAFSPNGETVLTSSNDGTARVWRLDGTAPPIVLRGRPGPTVDVVSSAVFSKDGKRVLMNSEDSVQVYSDDGSGKPIDLPGHMGTFSPDGTKIFTLTYDNIARLWNADGTGTPVFEDNIPISSVAFSPDGRRIVFGSGDRALIRTLDGTGPVVELKHPGNVVDVAFDPSGTRVATGSGDHIARVWDLNRPAPPILLSGHTGRVDHVEFNPDGSRLLTVSIKDAPRVWDLGGTRSFVELKADEDVMNAVFSPTGQKVLVGYFYGTVRIWNGDGSGQPLELTAHTGAVQAAFSRDGTRFVTGAMDNVARVWNVTDVPTQPFELHGVQGEDSSTEVVAFSPDSKKVVLGCSNGARIWNTDGVGAPVDLKGEASAVAFTADGTEVIVGSRDAGFRRFNVNGVGTPAQLAGATPGYTYALSSDGKKASDGLRVWNTDGTGQPILLKIERPRAMPDPRHADEPPPLDGDGVWAVTVIAFSPDGKRGFTGCRNGSAWVWDTGGSEPPTELKGHTGAIHGAAFDSKGERLVTGSADHTARVWSAKDAWHAVELKGHADEVRSVAFSPDGTKVLTGSFDHTARVWNANGVGQPIELVGKPTSLDPAVFSPDGEKVLMGGGEQFALLWNANGAGSPAVLQGAGDNVRQIAFSPDGRMAVTAGAHCAGALWLLDLRTVLWQKTPYCLPPRDRKALLGEVEAQAAERYQACLELARTCERGVELCREAVTKKYGGAGR